MPPWSCSPRHAVRAAATRPLVVALAAVATLAGSSLGCPPSGLGATCRFRGEETACGQCLATSCRAPIDACCAEDGVLGIGGCSETVLGQLDDCAGSGTCGPLFEDSSYEAAGTELRTCARACTAACGGADAGIAPGRACVKRDDGACTCSVTLAPSDAGVPTSSCTPDDVPGSGRAFCCADKGWPADDTTCVCLATRCLRTLDGTGCLCGRYGVPAPEDELEEVTSCSTPDEGACCVSTTRDTCRCGPGRCASDERTTSRCLPTDVTVICSELALDATSVSSCSQR